MDILHYYHRKLQAIMKQCTELLSWDISCHWKGFGASCMVESGNSRSVTNL